MGYIDLPLGAQIQGARMLNIDRIIKDTNEDDRQERLEEVGTLLVTVMEHVRSSRSSPLSFEHGDLTCELSLAGDDLSLLTSRPGERAAGVVTARVLRHDGKRTFIVSEGSEVYDETALLCFMNVLEWLLSDESGLPPRSTNDGVSLC